MSHLHKRFTWDQGRSSPLLMEQNWTKIHLRNLGNKEKTLFSFVKQYRGNPHQFSTQYQRPSSPRTPPFLVNDTLFQAPEEIEDRQHEGQSIGEALLWMSIYHPQFLWLSENLGQSDLGEPFGEASLAGPFCQLGITSVLTPDENSPRCTGSVSSLLQDGALWSLGEGFVQVSKCFIQSLARSLKNWRWASEYIRWISTLDNADPFFVK